MEEIKNIKNGDSPNEDGNMGESSKTAVSEDLSELEAIRAELDSKVKQCDEYLNMLQRTVAEFDNYKKRTLREKEGLYSDAVSDVVLAFLPLFDNMERAFCASATDECPQSLKEGIELVSKQMKGILKNLGIDEIQAVGKEFDPQLHNAVMHVSDDSCGHNIVVEEFQKGYIFKEKVIRHSLVKVAN